MKASQIGQAVMNGEILLVGTFFSGRVDRISVRDKSPGANGARKDFLIGKQVVMTEKEPITISTFLPDASSETEQGWKPSAKKGDRVVVHLKTLGENLGNKSGDGRIEVLEPETVTK